MADMYLPSDVLAKIIGSDAMSHEDVISAFWTYVDEHALRDPDNERVIRIDDNMREFAEGKDSLSLYEVTMRVNRHLRLVS